MSRLVIVVDVPDVPDTANAAAVAADLVETEGVYAGSRVVASSWGSTWGLLSVVERRCAELEDAIRMAMPPTLLGGLDGIAFQHDRVRRSIEKLRREVTAP